MLYGLQESFNSTDSIGIRTVLYRAETQQQYDYASNLFIESLNS